MRCYVAVHRCKLAINVESELSVEVALYSVASNRMAHRIFNAEICLVQVCALCDGSASSAPRLGKGISFAFYRSDDPFE